MYKHRGLEMAWLILEKIIMEGGGGMSEDLAGMEGYVYKIAYRIWRCDDCCCLSFLVAYVMDVCKVQESKRPLSIVSISIVLSFLFFICATGTYGSVFVYIYNTWNELEVSANLI